MSHLHKMRLAQVNDNVPDLTAERPPEQTALALSHAMTDVEVRDQKREVDADPDIDAPAGEDDTADTGDTSEEETEEEGDLTKDQLKSALDAAGVKYPANALKAELFDLYTQL